MDESNMRRGHFNIFDKSYYSLRKRAFEVTAEKLGITLDKDDQVYGAIVDMNVGRDKLATMVCFIDGNASLYFSNGGGLLGAGQNKAVKQIVASFLVSVHQVIPLMHKTEEYHVVPEENHHIFYLKTRVGTYTYYLDLNKVNQSKESSFLFSLSQAVLNEIRKTKTDKNKN